MLHATVMGAFALSLLVSLLAQLPRFLAGHDGQPVLNLRETVDDAARGEMIDGPWDDPSLIHADDSFIHSQIIDSRARPASGGALETWSPYNSTQSRGYRNRRLLQADATSLMRPPSTAPESDSSQPAMCPRALVTAYAHMDYTGPMVSLRCSSSDLSLMLCFPLASVAVKPGATLALFTHVGFTGDMLVLHRSEPRLFFNHPRKFAFASSLAICDALVDDPITDCPEGATSSLEVCHEETPLGHRVDPHLATTTHSDGEHFRASTDGRFVLQYMRPRAAYWQTPGPEACFYKTYVREAQMGCLMDPADQSFAELAREYIPRYHGVVHNFVYGSGEWVVLANLALGLVRPSMLVLDPSFGKCTRCGVDIRRYRTYMQGLGEYKLVDHDEIQRRHANAANKRKLIMHEVGEFFFNGAARRDVVKQLLPKIDRLHTLLKGNQLVSLVDVSLLVIYGELENGTVHDGEAMPYQARLQLVDFDGVRHANFSKAMSIMPTIFHVKPPGVVEGAEMSDPSSRQENHARGVLAFTCGVLEISLHLHGFAMVGKMKSEHCLAPCLGCW